MKAPERIRVAIYGLGQIGMQAAKAILERPELQLVGVIDSEPSMLQRDVADLAGLTRPSGIRVSNRASDVLGVARPDVVIVTTGSRFKSILPQLKECVTARTNVVSSCEELLLPHVRYAAQSRELDKLAKAHDVSVLGTGVNPGFVMDTMALVATAPCLSVKSVSVERVVDASTRRENLQKKVGAGLTTAQFRKGVKKGELGHVGLLESTYLVAEGLGWSLDRVNEKLTPITAAKRIKTPHVTVQAGDVAGIHHVCKGMRNRKEVVSLDLQMYVGAKKATDRISVQGTPDVNVHFESGIAGDEATVGMLLATVPSLPKLEPGLRTMTDVPIPHYHGAN